MALTIQEHLKDLCVERGLIWIVQKSELAKSYVPQRGKRK